jgi:hypothetical protein
LIRGHFYREDIIQQMKVKNKLRITPALLFQATHAEALPHQEDEILKNLKNTLRFSADSAMSLKIIYTLNRLNKHSDTIYFLEVSGRHINRMSQRYPFFIMS